MPFRELGGDPSLTLIAEGLANHLRSQLQRAPNLRPLSASEVARFGDDPRGEAEIARELVGVMRRDIKTDWTVRDDVRAKLRSSGLRNSAVGPSSLIVRASPGPPRSTR